MCYKGSKRFFYNQLFEPHVLRPVRRNFYQRAFDHDVPIGLYEFDDVRYVLGNLFEEEDMHANSQEDKAMYKGQKEDYVIVNMSVSDSTQEMIDEICALYAVDVLLMRHLNMKDEYCKGHVSDKYVSTLYLGKTWEKER